MSGWINDVSHSSEQVICHHVYGKPLVWRESYSDMLNCPALHYIRVQYVVTYVLHCFVALSSVAVWGTLAQSRKVAVRGTVEVTGFSIDLILPATLWPWIFKLTSSNQLVTANVVTSSPILVTLMMEALSSSKILVLTRATQHNITQDAILHSHRRENLKSYIRPKCCFLPI
jgi:hypothetical protein